MKVKSFYTKIGSSTEYIRSNEKIFARNKGFQLWRNANYQQTHMSLRRQSFYLGFQPMFSFIYYLSLFLLSFEVIQKCHSSFISVILPTRIDEHALNKDNRSVILSLLCFKVPRMPNTTQMFDE